MKFRVEDNETIEMCLKRMKVQGYTPVKDLKNLYLLRKKMVTLRFSNKKYNS